MSKNIKNNETPTLWTNSTPGPDSFGQLQMVAIGGEVAAALNRAIEDVVEQRTRAYETPLSSETLSKPIG